MSPTTSPFTVNSLHGIAHCPFPTASVLLRLTPAKSRAPSACSNSMTLSRNTLMTSMLIYTVFFLLLFVISAARPARAWKIPLQTSNRPQMLPTQSHSDAPFMTPYSRYSPSRKCTPPLSSLLPPYGHASGIQPPSPAGLYILHESRATSMLSFMFLFAVLSPLHNQPCHINSQHSRDRHKVACRDAGAGHSRPRSYNYLHRGTHSI